MSFYRPRLDDPQSLSAIIGQTDLPRNAYPSIRGSIRRLDPDNSSAVAYVPDLSGKTLTIFCTDGSFGEVTVTVTFTSNSFASALAAITAAGTANFEAVDAGGYLEVRSLRAGARHWIGIGGGTAVDLLGFVSVPAPGSTSWAGDIAGTPSTPFQHNSTATKLLGESESLSSASINRAVAAVAFRMESAIADLNKEVLVPFCTGPLTAKYISGGPNNGTYLSLEGVQLPAPPDDLDSIFDRTPKIPLSGLQMSGSNPGANVLKEFFTVLDLNGEVLYDPATFLKRNVDAVILGEISTINNVTLTRCFSASELATPPAATAVSIYGSNSGTLAQNTAKHAATVITKIDGDVVYCAGANFLPGGMLNALPGDLVTISGATNLSPYGHNGDMIVERVLDSKRLMLSKATGPNPTSSYRPSVLNPKLGSGEVYGSLTLKVGNSIPTTKLAVRIATTDITSQIPSGAKLVMLTARRPRLATFDVFAMPISSGMDGISRALYMHSIADPAHPAYKISITPASLGNWSDGDPAASSTNLRDALAQVVSGLTSTTTNHTGAHRIGAGAITGSSGDSGTGESPPYSITGNTVRDLIASLLQRLNDHAATPVHAGTATIDGNLPWIDGSPSPWETVDSTASAGIDLNSENTVQNLFYEIFGALTSVLPSHSGAHKIGCTISDPWLDTTPLDETTSVATTLQQIVYDLGAQDSSGRLDGASKIGSKGRGTTAANVADSVLAADSVGGMIEKMLGTTTTNQKVAVLDKINTFTKDQIFSELATFSKKITAEGGAVSSGTSQSPTSPVGETLGKPPAYGRRLWWSWRVFSDGGSEIFARLYTTSRGLEISYNAAWNGTSDLVGSNWVYDSSSLGEAWKWELNFRGKHRFFTHTGATSPWGNWYQDVYANILIDPANPSALGDAYVNTIVPATIVKAQIGIELNPDGTFTYLNTFNVTGAELSNSNKTLDVILPFSSGFTTLDNLVPMISFDMSDRVGGSTAPIHVKGISATTTGIRIFSSDSLLPALGKKTRIYLVVTGDQTSNSGLAVS